jgi:hypothetical protein
VFNSFSRNARLSSNGSIAASGCATSSIGEKFAAGKAKKMSGSSQSIKPPITLIIMISVAFYVSCYLKDEAKQVFLISTY